MDSSLALYSDCRLGQETYTKQKKLFDSSGLEVLHPWKSLRKKQEELTPRVLDLPLPHIGVYFSVLDAIKITTDRILEKYISQIQITPVLTLKIKFGFDGSGSHSVFNQVNNIQSNNIVLTMFCPLEIQDANKNTLWHHNSPNDPNSQRPLAIQMGKESSENLQTLSIFNDGLDFLEN